MKTTEKSKVWGNPISVSVLIISVIILAGLYKTPKGLTKQSKPESDIHAPICSAKQEPTKRKESAGRIFLSVCGRAT